jgi:hypothetical protein
LRWKILNFLLPFGEFYGNLVYFMAIWYIFPRLGMLYLSRKICQPWLTVNLQKVAFMDEMEARKYLGIL